MAIPRSTIDSHAHLWQRERTPQPWIDRDAMAAIDRDFWVDDLLTAQGSARIIGSVLVQSQNSLEETRGLLDIAASAAVLGVVGWIDLVGDVRQQLGLLEPAGPRYLKGIRHLVHQDPDPLWLARDDVARGLEQLADEGLPFDLVVRCDQLPIATAVVHEHPRVSFVLDHLGKPPIARGDLGKWREHIEELAECPNVVGKISGIAFEANWGSWSRGDLEPIVDHARNIFGPERLMFGSDWPLIDLSGGLAAWADVAADLIPHSDHTQIFVRTAERIYGLENS
jgi:L-fuconolactonase